MEIIKHPVDSNETCHVEFPPLFTFTVSHQRTLCVSPSSKKCENAVDMFSTNPAVDEARIATRTPAQDNRNYFSHYLLLQALHGPTRLRASPAGTLKLVTFRKQKEPTQMQDKKTMICYFVLLGKLYALKSLSHPLASGLLSPVGKGTIGVHSHVEWLCSEVPDIAL